MTCKYIGSAFRTRHDFTSYDTINVKADDVIHFSLIHPSIPYIQRQHVGNTPSEKKNESKVIMVISDMKSRPLVGPSTSKNSAESQGAMVQRRSEIKVGLLDL
jgi:hypothetical protein